MDILSIFSEGRWLVIPSVAVAFGAMIFFHELGHFLIAKWSRVTVHAFALGFGPRLFSFRRGETVYSLNLLPFGGFVKMAGEDFEDVALDEGSFRDQPVWRRIAIVAAGPIMNLFLAIAILSLVAMTYGVPVGVTNQVGTLVPGWPAQQVGLKPGDIIVAIDGTPTPDGREVVEIIHRSAGKPLVLTVQRGTEQFPVRVTPRLDPNQNIGLIGFSPTPIRQRLNPAGAVISGVSQTGEMLVRLVGAIVNLIQVGQLFGNLGGPVAAASALAQAARTGFENFLYMSAFLSVVIGLFNLFPFPALDGGRLAFLLVEAVRRRRVDPRREGYIHLVGFALLILLLLVLTYKDIQRLGPQ